MKKLLTCAALLSLISCGGEDVNGDGISDGLKSTDFRVFVTSEKYNGDLGGLNGADDKCNQIAKAAGLEREYIALLSDQTIDVKTRSTLTAGKVYVFRGDNDPLLVAESFDDLWSGISLKDKISYDEKFKLLTAQNSNSHEFPWTGSDSDGVKTTDNCQGWTRSDINFDGWTGTTDSTGTDWVERAVSTCNISRPLFCINKDV